MEKKSAEIELHYGVCIMRVLVFFAGVRTSFK